DRVFPRGSARPVAGSVLEEVLEGKLVYRESIDPPAYPEEVELLGLGLRSRVLAPLQVGPRTIGMLGLVRAEANAFAPAELELIALLGRLVATAVQNIRAYEAERSTADELRRLSALRADFVSLVSHELRSPMAAVIGAARTMQGRWRELTPEQRQSFLGLIGDETSRLATLIDDVLDTSRIEAGTFSFTFSDVDLGELLRDVVAAAEVAQAGDAELVPELARARDDRGAHLLRLEQDRLAPLRKDLADQPLRAAHGHLRERRAVLEQRCPALGGPAGGDALGVEHLGGARVAQAAGLERRPRFEGLVRHLGAAHAVEAEAALGVACAVPGVDAPVGELAFERVRL